MLFKKAKKRPMLLLEILIAMLIIVLCALPLLSPHISMIRAQTKLGHTIDLDRTVSNLFVQVVERLHKNEISWNAIVKGQSFDISQEMLDQAEMNRFFPFEGSYQLQELKKVENQENGWSKHLIKVVFSLYNKGSKEDAKLAPHQFAYEVFILKHVPMEKK